MYQTDRLKIVYEPYVDCYLVCYPKEGKIRSLNELSRRSIELLLKDYSFKTTAKKISQEFKLSHKESEISLKKLASKLLELGAIKKISQKSNNLVFPFPKRLATFPEDSFARPLRVQVELTSRCNLKCRHCYNVQKLNELKKEDWFEVIEKLDQWGVLKIQVAGGEPTLHGEFKDIISSFSKKNFSLMLFTNGTLIDKNLASFISKNFSSVQVSIDGDEKFHDSFRGFKGAYKKAMQGINYLIDQNCQVIVAMSVNLENLDLIQPLFNKCVKLKIPQFRLSPFALEGRAENYSYRVDDYIKTWKKIIRFVSQNQTNKITKILIPPQKSLKNVSRINHLCSAGRSLMYISSKGNIYPCPLLSKKEFIAGNALKDDLNRVWREASVFKELRSIKLKDLEFCKDCQSKCIYWCRAIVYYLAGDLKASAPYCPKKWTKIGH